MSDASTGVTLRTPYLLFLGDAPDTLAAKVAFGLKDWAPDKCVGQLRMAGCRADTQLPEMTIDQAVAAGAKTMVVGVATRGGSIPETWFPHLESALQSGLDLAAGLHERLSDLAGLEDLASTNAVDIWDVRHSTVKVPVGSGEPRSGRRLLTVGTDCSVGKMYTSLALVREMRANGLSADFKATGQTGILIAGSGIAVDAVVSDFISGAVEWLSPAAPGGHWDVIEGQGSLFHPSYAGVSLGLLHGAQAEALVLCHEPTRQHQRGLPGYSIPDLHRCIDANLTAARLTNPSARFVGVSVNTAALSPDDSRALLDEIEVETGFPAVDPLRNGVRRIVAALE